MRLMIVDDEPLAAERLVHLCAAIDGVTVIGVLHGSRGAAETIAALAPDAVLLDISMPGLDGMALGRLLRGLPSPPAIVFATAHDRHALAAFDLAAVDYLLKPVSAERLRAALARIPPPSTRPPGYQAAIWVPTGREMVRIETAALQLVEAERDYVRLHTTRGRFLLRETLARIEAMLDPSRFSRVHRSRIVAIAAIAGLTTGSRDTTLRLVDGSIVRVGRSYRREVLGLLARDTTPAG